MSDRNQRLRELVAQLDEHCNRVAEQIKEIEEADQSPLIETMEIEIGIDDLQLAISDWQERKGYI